MLKFLKEKRFLQLIIVALTLYVGIHIYGLRLDVFNSPVFLIVLWYSLIVKSWANRLLEKGASK